jgi:hypothetical protein
MNVTTAQLVFTSMKTNVSLLAQSDTSLTPPPTLVTHVTAPVDVVSMPTIVLVVMLLNYYINPNVLIPAQIDIITMLMSVLNVTMIVLLVTVDYPTVVTLVMLQDSGMKITVSPYAQLVCMVMPPLEDVSHVTPVVLIANKSAILSPLFVI